MVLHSTWTTIMFEIAKVKEACGGISWWNSFVTCLGAR